MTNTSASLEQLILKLVRDRVTRVEKGSSLRAIPGFDSTVLVQMIAEIEIVFGIEFEDADMKFDRLIQFDCLCELVELKIAARSAPVTQQEGLS